MNDNVDDCAPLTAGEWCILTCAPSRTLLLETALCKAGFAAWTPKATEMRHEGRGAVRRRVERQVPLLVGLVFADRARLERLIWISRSPGLIWREWDPETRRMEARELPPFSLFRFGDREGGFPVVSERSLAHLRELEARSIRRAAMARGKGRVDRPVFAAGAQVQLPGGGFEGLTGVVLPGGTGSYVEVEFPGATNLVKVAPHLLQAA